MEELGTGLWHWRAPHPDWTPGEEWGELVSSYAMDDGERLLLFDPLAPPDEIEELARRRDVATVLTCPWHARDARLLAERLGSALYAPPPDDGDPDPLDARTFEAGERLPVGVEAFGGMEPNDLVLWVESRKALVTGDTLVDRGTGLEFPMDWASRGAVAARGVAPAQILESLHPLLDLPVELVLATHGGPTDRAALERALA